MTKSLKIGLLHLAPELGALDANRALIESGTRIAAGLGADWVVSGDLGDRLTSSRPIRP